MDTQETSTTEVDLGSIAGLKLTASNSALIGSLLLWIVVGTSVAIFLHYSVIEGVALGLIGVVLHWIADIAHQLGHARAARASGHPMTAIRMWWLLSSSVYPPDEPTLPAAVHIKRALGGPILSFVISVASALVLALLPVGTLFWWIILFFAADNLLVFTLGSLLPLGFTDGSTLLHWRSKGE